jgi:hypothetical protein
MKGNFKATAAIALLESHKLAAPAVKKFGEAVAETYLDIARTERMNAARAIMIGMALPVLKASMPHGSFTPWMKANLTRGKIWSEATAIKNASFYTRLAHKFVEEARLSGGDVLALTEGETIRGDAAGSKAGAALIKKLEKFIDGRSITELLEDYGVKAGSGSGKGAAIELPPAGAADPLLADLSAHLVGLRELLLKPDQLKRFTARQIDEAERELVSTLEEFRQLKAKL